jgi:hypothetical protein
MEGEKRNVSDVLSWRYNRSVVARHGFFSAHRHATNDLGRRRIDRDLSVRLYIFFYYKQSRDKEDACLA